MNPVPAAAGSLAPELFAKARGIHLRVQRLVTEAFAGNYASAFKGRGMEFDELAEYQPGDDVRSIDWNATARTGRPHVKRHRAERELTVMLVVDVSASSVFGSRHGLKRDTAAEAAALLAAAATHSNDRVGLLLASDRVERYIPPRKGRGHVWRVIREVLGSRPLGRGTDLGLALEYLGRVLHRRALVFLISDFQTEGYDHALRMTTRHHDLTAVVIGDDRDAHLPALGIVELEDIETGARRLVDSADRRFSSEHLRRHAQQRRELETRLAAAHASWVNLSTGEAAQGPLLRFFRQRAPSGAGSPR